MFDMGFTEIILIGVIALIVIGPDKLPGVARNVGRWVGKMQRFVAGVKSDIASELQTDELRSMLSSQEDQIRELKTMVKETQTDLERTAKDAHQSITDGIDGAVSEVKEATDAAETASENTNKMKDIARAAGYGTFDEEDTDSASNKDSDSKDQDSSQSA